MVVDEICPYGAAGGRGVVYSSRARVAEIIFCGERRYAGNSACMTLTGIPFTS